MIKSFWEKVWLIGTVLFWTTCFWGSVLAALSLLFFFAWISGPAELFAGRVPMDPFNIFYSALSFAAFVVMGMVPFRLPFLQVEAVQRRDGWYLSFEAKRWREIG
jgi:hypothetical protein